MNPKNPLLLQINTRVFLNGISRRQDRPATLDDISESDIAEWSDAGFDWIYLLSVWQRGKKSRQISRSSAILRKEFEDALPDLQEEDIIGSGFAISGYRADGTLGGNAALKRFRARIAASGMKLMLDFVPNHVAPDHPWVRKHPGFFIHGTETDLSARPEMYNRLGRKRNDMILACGRDPNYPGWTDTVQLNYGNPGLQEAMMLQLKMIASMCDGVRCDMAMLLMPEVFRRTWGIVTEPFWPEAIRRVKESYPGFILMGEVYWDMEYLMLQQGFDYTYDKRLYDRLRSGGAGSVRDHLNAGAGYQEKLARFLENHDEPRIASLFSWEQHQAAAVITYLTPGLKFFLQGQDKGYKIRIPVQLGRAPEESADALTGSFYARLFALLSRPVLHSGEWELLETHPAWEGNPTHVNFIAFRWSPEESGILVVVNWASYRGQCRVFIPAGATADHTWQLHDRVRDEIYQRDGKELRDKGLYVDLEGWGFHVFELRMRNEE